MLKTLLLCLICCVIAGLIVIAYILLVELGRFAVERENDGDDEGGESE
jgi:hypothetical protein